MKWPSWTNVLLGLWLLIAPFTLGYPHLGAAVTSDVLAGLVIASLAFWRAVGAESPSMTGVSWVVALGGLWVLSAPFLLGYAAVAAAVANDVLVGLVVASLGTYRAARPAPRMPHDMQPHQH